MTKCQLIILYKTYHVFLDSARSIDFFSDILFLKRQIDKNDNDKMQVHVVRMFFPLTRSIKSISIYCNSYQIEDRCSSTLRS